MSLPDYYEILQVSPNAESEVIEAAYRRLAFKYHPDRNMDAKATVRMRDINLAYEILSQPDARKKYDEDTGFASNARQQPQQTALSPMQQGGAYLAQRKYELAVKAYNSAFQVEPSGPRYYHNRAVVYHNRAVAYLYLQQYDLAIKDLDVTIELEPLDPIALTNRGSAFLSMRAYERAITDFNMSLSLNPKYELATRKLSEAIRLKGISQPNKTAPIQNNAQVPREDPLPDIGNAALIVLIILGLLIVIIGIKLLT